MNIQIVEDVGTIADRLERLTREALAFHLPEIHVSHSLESARHFMQSNMIDLLLLDLNLNGKNGFKLLEEIVAEPFHTIIVSAYTDKAITAFEYGVLDFVAKPFTRERIQKALSRFVQNYLETDDDPESENNPISISHTKFLAIREHGLTKKIPLEKIAYLAGASGYTEIMLEDGKSYIHCKSIGLLSAILPADFTRIHKSYIVRASLITNISIVGDHKYEAALQNGARLPVSRKWYQEHINSTKTTDR